MNALDALNQLSLGSKAPRGERLRLRGDGAAPADGTAALPPAVPTMTASSTNTLDPSLLSSCTGTGARRGSLLEQPVRRSRRGAAAVPTTTVPATAATAASKRNRSELPIRRSEARLVFFDPRRVVRQGATVLTGGQGASEGAAVRQPTSRNNASQRLQAQTSSPQLRSHGRHVPGRRAAVPAHGGAPAIPAAGAPTLSASNLLATERKILTAAPPTERALRTPR